MRTILRFATITIVVLLGSGYVYGQTLSEYVTIAANNNAGLKAKYLLYQAALEKVPQVGTLPDPEISFGYFISPVETRVGAQRATISARQMFPWFGALAAQKNLATENAKAHFEAFAAERKKLEWKVAQPYFALYTIEEKIQILQSNIVILKTFETLATQKYEQGKGSMVDVLRVQLEIAEQETKIQLLRDKREPLFATFNQLLHRAIDDVIILPDSLSNLPLLWSDSVALDSVLHNNPVLVELIMKQRALEARMTVIKKQGSPSFGVGLNYIIISERSDVNIADNGKDALLPMVSLRIPLYRKKYKAQLKETELTQQAVELTETELRYQLTSSVMQAISDYRDAEQRIMLYQSQQQKVRQMLRLMVESYAVDGKNFEELLRLQQLLLKYENNKVDAVRDLHLANSKLKSL